jgi:hypothetical protein
MFTLPFSAWIGNAAAVLCGRFGEVTRRAREVGCSRQTLYDQAQKVQDALERPTPKQFLRILREKERLERENQQLFEWLAETTDFPKPKQQEFSATASAMGLSLTQIAVLLGIVMGAAAAPRRTTIGRWVAAACQKASAVLKVLDRACRPLVVALCLDEIFFHQKPVLVGVEPASMAWVIGQRAPDRSGQTWLDTLRAWDHLESAVADAGSGLQSGLKQLNELRASDPQAPQIDVGLDIFHIKKEALPVLIRQWKSAEALWEQAEAADRVVIRCRTQGHDARPAAAKARAAWTKATTAFHAVCALEAVWQRAEAALTVFRDDGTLNDRATAEAALAAVVEHLPGAAWAKVRRMLSDERTLTFLDRLHRQLLWACPDETLRGELVQLCWLRRQQQANPNDSLWESRLALQKLLCQRLNPKWSEAYRAVVRVIRAVVRASSLVECMNSVIRMQQARHRFLSQPLLDLKRLYWNGRPFREGHRRGQSPYQHLNLPLPTHNWWTLLNIDPQFLAQKLSSQ